MRKEVKIEAKTAELAAEKAAAELGVTVDALQYEVTREAKKGFLGIGGCDAEILAWIEVPAEKPAREPKQPRARKAVPKTEASAPAEVPASERKPLVDTTAYAPAIELLNTILADFGLTGSVELSAAEGSDTVYGELVGDGMEALLGHHGETLDALQYLCNLRLRQEDEDGVKLKLDIAGYRAKREATLCKLAERKAEQALKYNRSVVLEPMNPYERRIIHASVQNIPGVTTISTGTQNSRRVVIYPEGTTPDLGSRRPRR